MFSPLLLLLFDALNACTLRFFAIYYFWQCEKWFHETSSNVSSSFGFVFYVKDISMFRTLCSDICSRFGIYEKKQIVEI